MVPSAPACAARKQNKIKASERREAASGDNHGTTQCTSHNALLALLLVRVALNIK